MKTPISDIFDGLLFARIHEISTVSGWCSDISICLLLVINKGFSWRVNFTSLFVGSNRRQQLNYKLALSGSMADLKLNKYDFDVELWVRKINFEIW